MTSLIDYLEGEAEDFEPDLPLVGDFSFNPEEDSEHDHDTLVYSLYPDSQLMEQGREILDRRPPGQAAQELDEMLSDALQTVERELVKWGVNEVVLDVRVDGELDVSYEERELSSPDLYTFMEEVSAAATSYLKKRGKSTGKRRLIVLSSEMPTYR